MHPTLLFYSVKHLTILLLLKGVLAFENRVLTFEKAALAFEKVVLAFEN
jgi:hypothetical protein